MSCLPPGDTTQETTASPHYMINLKTFCCVKFSFYLSPVPEDSLELTQEKTTDEGQIKLSCEADGVFPKPELTFIKKETG